MTYYIHIYYIHSLKEVIKTNATYMVQLKNRTLPVPLTLPMCPSLLVSNQR